MRLSTMQYTRNGGSLVARALKHTPRVRLASAQKHRQYHDSYRSIVVYSLHISTLIKAQILNENVDHTELRRLQQSTAL